MGRIRPLRLRPFVCFLVLVAAAYGQQPSVPKVGIIEVYGIRKTPEARVRKVLGLTEGAPLPPSKGDLEEKIEAIPGLTQARLEAVCCDDTGKAILYVGVEEKGAPHFATHEYPADEKVSLPEEIGAAYGMFLRNVNIAAQKGHVAEDLTRGHSLMEDDSVQAVQLRFVEFAGKYLNELRAVLRNSASDEQRAMAAYVIGYAPKKETVLNDLQYALQDPDDTVRNNAMRALAAIAVYARKNPDAELKISPTWLIEMLNSIYWGDRHNATVALVTLTDSRDEDLLKQIKERAMPALVEMARWKHLPHALPAYILLGRVAGYGEEEMQKAWSNNDRESIIKGAVRGKK